MAATAKVMAVVPDPDVGMPVIQPGTPVAFQAQPALVLTLNEPEPPAAEALWLVGSRE